MGTEERGLEAALPCHRASRRAGAVALFTRRAENLPAETIMSPLRPTTSKPPARFTAAQSIPAWQSERARQLHTLFARVSAACQNGRGLSKSFQRFARRWSGKPFKSDSAKRWAVSSQSLYQHWRRWRRGGQVESALFLKYVTPGPAIPQWVVVRFHAFVCKREFPNFRAAWDTFCARGCPAQFGCKPRHARIPVTYQQLRYNYSTATFRESQRLQGAIKDAERAFNWFRLRVDAEIRERLPVKPQRRRCTREELSLLSSEL